MSLKATPGTRKPAIPQIATRWCHKLITRLLWVPFRETGDSDQKAKASREASGYSPQDDSSPSPVTHVALFAPLWQTQWGLAPNSSLSLLPCCFAPPCSPSHLPFPVSIFVSVILSPSLSSHVSLPPSSSTNLIHHLIQQVLITRC